MCLNERLRQSALHRLHPQPQDAERRGWPSRLARVRRPRFPGLLMRRVPSRRLTRAATATASGRITAEPQHVRALRHALAEYDLRTYSLRAGSRLAEVLSR